MRFIDLKNNPPPQEWIDEAIKLKQELAALTPEERSQFIKHNSEFWGRIKAHLLKLSYGKCWYTEAKEIASVYHIEHFRPKNKILHLKADECGGVETTINDETYWWLAFDWKNYRISASRPNTAKNCYFPLRIGSAFARKKEDIENEVPALIDPTERDDVLLLDVDLEGRVCPAAEKDTWEAQRVQISIRVYDLNYQPLVDQRVQVQNRCKRLICELISISKDIKNNNNTYARTAYKEKISELRNMMEPHEELSATVKQYLLGCQYTFIKNIAI